MPLCLGPLVHSVDSGSQQASLHFHYAVYIGQSSPQINHCGNNISVHLPGTDYTPLTRSGVVVSDVL